jgi:hypothetical protein
LQPAPLDLVFGYPLLGHLKAQAIDVIPDGCFHVRYMKKRNYHLDIRFAGRLRIDRRFELHRLTSVAMNQKRNRKGAIIPSFAQPEIVAVESDRRRKPADQTSQDLKAL